MTTINNDKYRIQREINTVILKITTIINNNNKNDEQLRDTNKYT